MSTLVSAVLIIISWGIWGFISKLATVRMAWPMVVIINTVFTAVWILLFLFNKISFKIDSITAVVLIIGALLNAFAAIIFYKLISTNPISIMIALTSLYPAVTIILGIIFLHESLTIKQILGIIFAVVAVFLLSF